MRSVLSQRADGVAGRIAVPLPETPVLVNRKLRPGTDLTRITCFQEDRWDFAAAVHEEHAPACSLSFQHCPQAFLLTAKTYVWFLLNCPSPPSLRRTVSQLAVLTLVPIGARLFPFFDYLLGTGITRLADVQARHYDGYLSLLNESACTQAKREDLVQEVRRLGAHRDVLPAHDALPDAPPWDGDETSLLVGARTPGEENLVPRIAEDTMHALLLWSLRYIEELSADIIPAWNEYKLLARRNQKRRPEGTRRHRYAGEVTALLTQWLARQHARGEGLPGRTAPGGGLQLDVQHLVRLFNCGGGSFAVGNPNRTMIDSSGLPLENGALLDAPITVELAGKPWRAGRIRYQDAETHARRLATACFIVIAYLSGMRPGEVLSTERGCVTQDPATGLRTLTGTTWKDAKDPDGNKIPEGQTRAEPWIVVEPVARAVHVLEQLHDSRLLFPTLLDEGRYPTTTRAGKGRLTSHITRDLNDFVTAVNVYCAEHHRNDPIPADPAGTFSARRFRRTLAWHIIRRPRGLVAAAIQYGHVRTQVTLGYGGTFASGFPDLTAVEEFLQRLEDLIDDDEHLQQGGHVSGPAADAYRQRVHDAKAGFAGRVLRSDQQIRAITQNPALQVFPGQGMTCVFDARTAACELPAPRATAYRRTPALDGCRPHCANLARTDHDVAELQIQADRLTRIVADPLAPPIRHRREQETLHQISATIDAHHASAPRPRGDAS